MFFFFFQAEDGIRDKLVTGVQTCALPISGAPVSREKLFAVLSAKMLGRLAQWNRGDGFSTIRADWLARATGVGADIVVRSEERRVGKECRSRWSPYH